MIGVVNMDLFAIFGGLTAITVTAIIAIAAIIIKK